MIKAPYDERNQADYLKISSNIEAALILIESNLEIPATEVSLAGLAKCSRGTLRNRVYPLERLRAIKSKRAEQRNRKKRFPRLTLAHRINVEAHIDEKQALQRKLQKSRSELANWVAKYSDLEREVSRLERVNDFLTRAKKILEDQIEGLKVSLREKEERERKFSIVKS